MADNLTASDRLKTMRAVRSKNTGLERKLFAMLAGMHLRGWRRHAADIQGHPDAVFDTERVAIFVHGCFWHGCPECQRPMPATNAEYWAKKIGRNIQRDQTNQRMLTEEGWEVVAVWEHEIRDAAEREDVRQQLRNALAKDRSAR